MTDFQGVDGWRVLTDEQAIELAKTGEVTWRRTNAMLAKNDITGAKLRKAYHDIAWAQTNIDLMHARLVATATRERFVVGCPKVMGEDELEAALGGLTEADMRSSDTLIAALNRETARVLAERDR